MSQEYLTMENFVHFRNIQHRFQRDYYIFVNFVGQLYSHTISYKIVFEKSIAPIPMYFRNCSYQNCPYLLLVCYLKRISFILADFNVSLCNLIIVWHANKFKSAKSLSTNFDTVNKLMFASFEEMGREVISQSSKRNQACLNESYTVRTAHVR